MSENTITTIVNDPTSNRSFNESQKVKTLAEVEKEYILETLKSVNGSKAKAAKLLGVTVKTVYNKLHKFAEQEKFKKIMEGNIN